MQYFQLYFFRAHGGDSFGNLYMITKAYANIWGVFFLVADTENGSCPHQRTEPVDEGMWAAGRGDIVGSKNRHDLKIDYLKIDMLPRVP